MTERIEQSIKGYVDKSKYLQEAILKFIETKGDAETEYRDIVKYIEEQKICKNRNEMQSFLHLLLKISNEHHRCSEFFSKIEKIFLNFKEDVKTVYSNYEIFQKFKSNKRLLLFLIKEGIVKPDKAIASTIRCHKYKQKHYPHFFLKEFRSFFDEIFLQNIDEDIEKLNHEQVKDTDSIFEQKRQIGENDHRICELIRNDSLEEFKKFVQQLNLSLASNVEQSIFETNPFLIGKTPTLIEYSAFFGAIKIFNYLISEDVVLTPSLWLYSIHSNNSDITKILEEKKIKPEDETFKNAFIESIKCHHISIASSIKSNNIKNKPEIIKSVLHQIIKYYNYSFFPDEYKFNEVKLFSDFCKYNYYYIVRTFLTYENLPINLEYVFKFFKFLKYSL